MARRGEAETEDEAARVAHGLVENWLNDRDTSRGLQPLREAIAAAMMAFRAAPARAAEWQPLTTKEEYEDVSRRVTREISQPLQSSAATDTGHQQDSAERNDDGD